MNINIQSKSSENRERLIFLSNELPHISGFKYMVDTFKKSSVDGIVEDVLVQLDDLKNNLEASQPWFTVR